MRGPSRPVYQAPALAFQIQLPRSEQLSQAQSLPLGLEGREGEANLQQTPHATAQPGARSFATLEAVYSVPSPIAIETLLQNHAQLTGLLFSAFPRIKATWGAEAKPELNLVDHPDGGSPLLMVRIISSAPNTYEALDRFDEDWWLDHIRNAEGLLNFSPRTK